MKVKFFACLLLLSEAHMVSAQLEYDYKIKGVNTFIERVKNRKVEELSAYVKYPVWRQSPLIDILDATDFQNRFDEIFDEELIQAIVRSDPKTADWEDLSHKLWFKDYLALDQNGEYLTDLPRISDIEKQKIASLKPLNETEIIGQVLRQLGLSKDKVYDRFYQFRALPWDETKSAVILPVIAEFQDYNDYVLDAYVLVINNLSGKNPAKIH